jgi:mono/diheme cytochrome c family protein
MVMKIGMLTYPGLLVAGLLLCGSAMAQGRVLYLENCAACHGTHGAGDGAVAKVLTVRVPDLRRISALSGGRFPEDWVRSVVDGREQILSHGDRAMPVWGSEFWLEEGGDEAAEAATRARIRELVDYLASIQVTD